MAASQTTRLCYRWHSLVLTGTNFSLMRHASTSSQKRLYRRQGHHGAPSRDSLKDSETGGSSKNVPLHPRTWKAAIRPVALFSACQVVVAAGAEPIPRQPGRFARRQALAPATDAIATAEPVDVAAPRASPVVVQLGRRAGLLGAVPLGPNVGRRRIGWCARRQLSLRLQRPLGLLARWCHGQPRRCHRRLRAR